MAKSKRKTNPQTKDARLPTYEDKTIALAEHAIRTICQQVPELRSAAIVFDWEGKLSEVSIAAIWQSAAGPVTLADNEAIMGALKQTMKLMQLQTAAVFEYSARLSQTIATTREQMIRESNLNDKEKEALVATIQRGHQQIPGAVTDASQESHPASRDSGESGQVDRESA